MSEKPAHWLDWACLGPDSSEWLPEEAWERLKPAYRRIAEWTRRWSGTRSVNLTSGTTEGIELAVRCMGFPVTGVFVTDLAHSTARMAADVAARANGTRAQVLPVKRLLRAAATEREFADLFASALVEHGGDGSGAVLIVEHIGSAGHLLPIERLSEELERRDCRTRIVVDGAQAVGVMRVPRGWDAYSGCFHKYVDAPAGTGFLALKESADDCIPYSVQARSGAARPPVPTERVGDWLRCDEALKRFGAPVGHVAELEQKRAAFIETFSGGDESWIDGGPPLAFRAPNILMLNMRTEETALVVRRRAASRGYAFGVEGRSLRVSLHHSLPTPVVREAGQVLRDIVSRQRLATGRSGDPNWPGPRRRRRALT